MKLLLSWCRPWQKRSKDIQTSSFFLRLFKYEELKKATKDFSSELQLGYGLFVGTLPDSTRVAVRILPTNITSARFGGVVWWIKKLHHINLVRLIGYCDDHDQVGFGFLVFDYFPNRSLDLNLFQPPPPADEIEGEEEEKGVVVLDWNRRYHIALGTARALSHLHRQPMDKLAFYIHTGSGNIAPHGSISPQNIVLDSDFCPKVSDYGLSYFLASNTSTTGKTTAITTSYVAPEVLSERLMTHKSDVYSYGMILFELVSGIRNCENGETPKSFPTRVASVIRAGSGVGHGHDNIILSMLDWRLAGDINADEEDVLRMCTVACWCVHHDPNRRPHMHQVVDVLEGVMDENIIDLSSWI